MPLLNTLLGLAGLLAGPPRAPFRTVVTVKNGSYVGVHSPQYDQDFFLGMPYAQKPVRFANSQHLNSSWDGTRQATEYPLHCVGYGIDMAGYETSEDCLYLNVIRPAGIDATAQLPVAVYIHGGGLYMGGSADKRYNLSFMVQRSVQLGTPMVGVSLNYRVTAFGFLWGKEAVDAGVGNVGFKDQRLALRWINENIGFFGGCRDKVTLFGESSGAESISAQMYAYNGRDDGLLRAAIGQSGFSGQIPRFPGGGLTNTATMQRFYDDLVSNTSCASTVSTAASLDCLRALPFSELDAHLKRTAASWGPVMDGDFIADYPSLQLRDGRFLKMPLLMGTNTDEGTSFVDGRRADTDAETHRNIAAIMPDYTLATAGKAPDQLADELMELYPDDQAVGIPGLDKFPILKNGSHLAKDLGLQYRRAGAVFGDFMMQYTRRRTSIAWSNHKVPSWSYRFDVVPHGTPGFMGAKHFAEVAFVFYNLLGQGYAENPFANASAEYMAVAKTMSAAWIHFIVTGSGAGLTLPDGTPWPVYEADKGQNCVFAVNGSYLEKDDWRKEGLAWMAEHSLDVFGN